jgi:hypothetical protein
LGVLDIGATGFGTTGAGAVKGAVTGVGTGAATGATTAAKGRDLLVNVVIVVDVVEMMIVAGTDGKSW